MSSTQSIFSSLIRIGLILGALGALPRVTLYLAREAFESHQHGLVSLTRLNQSLGMSPHSPPTHSKQKDHYAKESRNLRTR